MSDQLHKSTGYTGWRPGETYKRSARASAGMVTANHPLGAAAGAEMLARGGNAVDAAIAACLAVSVVEPAMSSIFGAGFMLIRLADGRIVGLDNYIRSPAAARDGMFRLSSVRGGQFEVKDELNATGHLSVGVPGSLKAYELAVAQYGALSWRQVCGPAIRFAREGFAASPMLVDQIRTRAADLARFPATAEVFLPKGEPPSTGASIVRSDYGDTLEAVSRQGAGLLYSGELGARVAADMRVNGGVLTIADLQSYEVRPREPVRTAYRGYEVVGMGPCASGGTVVAEALNLLEGFDLRSLGFGTARSVHLLAEALKIAFADRNRYLGDPDEVSNPVAWLTSKEYAERRRADMALEKAGRPVPGMPQHGEPGAAEAMEASAATRGSSPGGEGANTTHVTACDAAGNMVATTQTLNDGFGSCVTVPGTGMLLNNCMKLFDPRPGRRQSVGPSKRPVSSNAPTLVFKDGRPFMALGTPGATRIIAAVLQTIVNVIDHGMSLQAAVEAPRCHAGTEADGLLLELGFGKQLDADLAAMGHSVERVVRVAGGLNAIMYGLDGLLEGAACWRADGAPIGVSGGPAIEPPGGFRAGVF